MKTVAYTTMARRELRKLPAPVQSRIAHALRRYAETAHGNVKKLAGGERWRLRIGDYRVLFRITPAQIEVVGVRHRKDAYI